MFWRIQTSLLDGDWKDPDADDVVVVDCSN